MIRNPFVKSSLAAILGVGLLTLSVGAFGRDQLTLRVNDAVGAPGGLTAVVVRTYASRPAGQGQICIVAGSLAKAAGTASGAPFAELVDAVVFSSGKDARSAAVLKAHARGQEIVIQFSSESGTINRTDGPLAVLYFRLRDDLRPGATFEVSIDPANTVLIDAAGNVIPTEPRAGELTVRALSDPYMVEAEGDKVAPGATAELGIETFEPFAIANGQIGLRYDASAQGGRAKVRMSRKYGTRRYSVDRSTPGLLLITFRSPRADLGLVPGSLVRVDLPTRSDMPVGTGSRVAIDPALTYFVDPEGDLMPLRFESERLRFRRDGGSGGGDDSDSGDDDGEDDSDGDDDSDADDGDSDDDGDGDDADSDGDSDSDADDDSDDDDDSGSDDDDDSDSEAG